MINKILIAGMISLTCLVLLGCAANPVTGRDELMLYSEEDDFELGRQVAPRLEKALGDRIPGEALQLYLDRVGQRIALVCHHPEWEYHYIAVDHEMVNAMALPGGYIYITRGMLERLQTEAQLAAVLAHETVHVVGRHTASQMSKQAAMGLATAAVMASGSGAGTLLARMTHQVMSLSYSREDETESDTAGLDYLVKAGYDPNGMVQIQEILLEEHTLRRELEFYSTHPHPETRLEAIRGRIKRHYSDAKPSRTDDLYQTEVLDYLKNHPKLPKSRRPDTKPQSGQSLESLRHDFDLQRQMELQQLLYP
jgi:predicted Zn-dependent protease